MAQTLPSRKRIRKQFGSIGEVAEMPNLIEVQKASYDDFLMVKEPPGGRHDDFGLQSVFKGVFPISDFAGKSTLEFVRYDFEAPKFDVDECMQRDMTYLRAAQGQAAPHRVRCERGDGLEVDQGREGAGRLHGRHAPDDVERHVRHQRHRARHRLADAPFAGRLLRSRPRQDAFVRQAVVCGPHHSLSRLLARLRIRRQRHRLCAHRPPPQAAGDDDAVRARPRRRADPVALLQAHRGEGIEARLEDGVHAGEVPRLHAPVRRCRRQDRRSHRARKPRKSRRGARASLPKAA